MSETDQNSAEQKKSALLVVDVQVGVMEEAWQADQVIEKIRQLVVRAREENIPVIWVQHASDELIEGSAQWQIVPELTPMPNEAIVPKSHNSAFADSTLKEELQAVGATHIVLVGAASNWCIRATAYGAVERGYDLTLVSDAHSTGDMPLNETTTVSAKDIIRELNVSIHWMTYPGLSNQVCHAQDVVFSS